MAVKICPQCGTRYEGDNRFCTLDGASLVSESPTDTLVGTVLADRYLVKEKLGEGGMGEVYLAEHVRMKRKVAVKVMRRAMVSDAEAIGRFHREAENASQITHPNVAAVYDFGETPDKLAYLAMEYVPGESLTRILERERLVHHIRASDLVGQIADALMAAHALGILHRDLKPDNVMVARTRADTDLVKLLDFGIARVMGRETQNLTRTGLVVGTPEWMSPEQIAGEKLDARADIYALGLIAFRLLAGEGAFAGTNSQEILLAKMTRPARRLSEVRPEVTWPDALEATLARALATDPAARYGDALELARDFYAGVATLPLTVEAEAYLTALSQRVVTPSHGMGLFEATPPRGVHTISTPIPSVRRPTPVTPPSVSQAPAASFDPSEGDIALGVVTPPPRPALKVPVVSDPAETEVEEGAAEDGGDGGDAGGSAPVPPPGSAEPTPRRRLPWVPIAGAVAAVITAAVLLKGGGAPAPVDGALADSLADSSALAGDSAALDSAAAVASAAGSIGAALDAVALGSRDAVFGVVASGGKGSGFLADSTGLVLTAASLVGSDSLVQVFFDGARRVVGTVVHKDDRAGLAALLIPVGRCDPACAPLALAPDTAQVAAGDSVAGVAAQVITSSFRNASGAVHTNTSQVNIRLGTRRVGAPLLRADGSVVGVVRSGSASRVTVTPAGPVHALLTEARNRVQRQRLAARDSLLPSWPSTAMSTSAVNAGRSRTAAEIEGFHVEKDDFDVFVMTPQVMAWRQAAADSMRKTRSMNITQPECRDANATCDPIEQWSTWPDYLAERRAVVMVQVSPAAARAPRMGKIPRREGDIVNFSRGDFRTLVLTSDGNPVAPIESIRFPAVANPEEYIAQRRSPPFDAGLYVFHPADFVTASGQPRRVTLTVWDETRGDRPVTIEIPASVVQKVAADVGSFARGR